MDDPKERSPETVRSESSGPRRSTPGALRVRCPHCHNPIEVLNADLLGDLECPSCGSHFSLIAGQSTATYTAEGKRIGRFTLLEQVGVGHFGSVWKARDSELARLVAVKIPRRGELDAAGIEQFMREPGHAPRYAVNAESGMDRAAAASAATNRGGARADLPGRRIAARPVRWPQTAGSPPANIAPWPNPVTSPSSQPSSCR
jgi:hypothetical protein